MNGVKLFVVAISILLPQLVLADETLFEKFNCSSLLEGGKYEDTSIMSESSQFRLVQSTVCSEKISTYSQAVQQTSSLGLGLDIFDLDFSGSTASSNFSSWKSSFCSAKYDQIQNHYSYRDVVRKVSPVLMETVKVCIQEMAKNQDPPGIKGWVEISKDRDIVIFRAKYKPFAAEKSKIDVFTITPKTVRKVCKEELKDFKRIKYLDNAIRSFTCSVDPDTTFAISLKTTQGAIDKVIEKKSYLPKLPTPDVSFTSSVNQITSGQKCKLTWDAKYTDYVEISPSIGKNLDNKGSVEVSPTATTTYTLIAKGVGGLRTYSLSVIVNQIDPTVELESDKNEVAYGNTAKLKWDVKNADAVTIDQGIGLVSNIGETTISPLSNTIYTLTAIKGDKRANKAVAVNVVPKAIVWEHIDKDGARQDYNSNQSLGILGSKASSIQVNTNEWAILMGFRGVNFKAVAIKGPKSHVNLTDYDFNDMARLITFSNSRPACNGTSIKCIE